MGTLYCVLEIAERRDGYRVIGYTNAIDDSYDLLMAKWRQRLVAQPNYPIKFLAIWSLDVLLGFVAPVLTFDDDAGEHWHEDKVPDR